jgi:formylglycine-generating enzyme required for sulfatase activity
MKKFFITTIFLWITIVAGANNVNISNISLVGSAGNYRVQFDLSWDNGWRVSTGQNNYDGVWVFFKFRIAGGNWQHLTMTGTGNAVPANYTAYQNTGATKTGAIIHRTNNFTGSTTLTDIELGVSDIVGFEIDIRGYAIEMVYIPPCSNCVIGDGNGSSESENAFHLADNTAWSLGTTFHTDVNTFDDDVLETGGAGIAINAAGITGNPLYTTGQAAWSMKYELSQGGYRDFLNSLNLAQQTTRTENPPGSGIGTGALITGGIDRNKIEISISSIGGASAVYGLDADGDNIFDEANDGEWVACNYLSWMDIAAYLDWAGLAPMTEILYERICRGASTVGPNFAVLNEYAWGTTSIFPGPNYNLATPFTATETVSNASPTLGNASYGNISGGPLRNGIFATGASNRVTSGAAFYGVMEMSGNVTEPCVTVGNVAGRGFTSVNGDGVLSANGNASALNWPCSSTPSALPICGEVTGSAGTISKGGHWANSASFFFTSYRNFAVSVNRSTFSGCRGVLYIN